MAFRTTVSRTDVLKEKDAVELIRQEMVLCKERGDTAVVQQLRESIKVTRTLLKSALPLNAPVTLEDWEVPEFYDQAALDLIPDVARDALTVPLRLYLEKKGLVTFYEGGEQVFTLG